jgi:hypothetical protein
MMDTLDDRVEQTLLLLRAAAVEQQMSISGDDRIGESCAAKLLGVECETLSKRRQEGRSPVAYKVPVGGSRVSYRLSDLARWVEAQREDF